MLLAPQELVSTPIITSISTTEKIVETPPLEPFPYHPDPSRHRRSKGPPPPSPSKFVKGEFRESDYESDYEGRIPPVWRPSSTEPEPSYRPVRPVLTPSGRHSQNRERTPTPPTQFDVPPEVESTRPKFEPIDKPKTVKTDVKSTVYKPTPVIAKQQITDVIIATPAAPEKMLQPGTPPEIGYIPGPTKTQYYRSTTSAPFQNAVQTETSNVVHFDESTEHSRRTVSLQQTTRVIKFGDKQKEQDAYSTKPRFQVPSPPKPSKFTPGEYRESDYESEVESKRIKTKWAPSGSDTEESYYRKVKAPPVTRSSSVPASREKVHTPVEFDGTTSSKVLTESSSHVSDLSKRFEETKSSQVVRKSAFSEEALKPGSPPEYGYVPDKITKTAATKMASKHMDDMTRTFKSKTQKFVTDIMDDVSKKQGVQKPILKPSDDGDAQVYREETRAANYGELRVMLWTTAFDRKFFFVWQI